MKRNFCFVLTFAMILIIACNNPNKDVEENPYEGAWELTYSKWVFPDTIYEITQFVNPSVKLLTKKHWAFVRLSEMNEVYAGTGEYTFDSATYTENIKLHYNTSVAGNSFGYKSSIEGDLWKISIITMLDSVQVEGTETWKRIIE